MPVNEELVSERTKACFDVHKMGAFFHVNEANLARRKFIAELVENTPEFKDPKNINFMSPKERYENAMRKTYLMAKLHGDIIDVNNFPEMFFYQKLVLVGDIAPLYLHYVMFIPTLLGQCDEKQLEKWLPLAYNQEIIGTYAQTELGHGTNLKKLETTATYDPDSEQFIVDTPTLTATKWWPGNLGKTSNYAIIMAQLYIAGSAACLGVHPFLVQIRDMASHRPLKGITVGDIGPKFGTHSNDNGFLRLNKVRVPRDHMLARYSHVTKEGKYVRAPSSHSKAAYGSMLYVRSIMLYDQSAGLGAAATIAARYSCIRRQGEWNSCSISGANSERECKIMDYQTQQYRILPEIAKTFAYILASRRLFELYTETTGKIKEGDTGLIPELHALASGLKAHCTFQIAKGIEQCRLACGGHGYSLASSLPQIYANTSAGCTYEGDNLVMLLQVARHLIKHSNNNAPRRLSPESLLTSPSDYLDFNFGSQSQLTSEVSQEHLLTIYQQTSQRLLTEVTLKLKQLINVSKVSPDHAWQQCTIHLTKCAKAHTRVFLVQNFMDRIKRYTEDDGVRKMLNKVCKFFSMYDIFSKPGSYLEAGFLSKVQLQWIKQEFVALMLELREQVVPLVDSFHFHDRELMNSCLGRFDGNVYESLLDFAKGSPLNDTEVLGCHFEYMAPKSQEVRSKL